MPLQVVCPGCGSRLPVDDSMIGKKIRCGGCNALIDIPKREVKANPVSESVPANQRVKPAANTMLVICTCRARFTVPTSARGTQQRCPTCGNLVLVPSPSSAAPSPVRPRNQSVFTPARLPSSPPLQNPYRRQQATPKSNKPIIVTAVVGVAALILVIGGTLAIQFFNDYRLAKAETEAETASEKSSEAATQKPDTPVAVDSQSVTESPPPDPPEQAEIRSEDTKQAPSTPTSTPMPVAPAPATPKPVVVTKPQPLVTNQTARPIVQAPVKLAPPSEQGLYRVHIPEGYSIAVPPGFDAAPRRINGQTASYMLGWTDGTMVTLSATHDKKVTANTPVTAGMGRGVSRDGKLMIQPVTRADNPNIIETFKVNGMNACFAELQQDISHPDMTQQLNQLFSGAMPSEAKQQLAPLMRERKGWRGAFIMKAMDDEQILDVAVMAVRDKRFRPPQQWFDVLRTVRREDPPNPNQIPSPFARR